MRRGVIATLFLAIIILLANCDSNMSDVSRVKVKMLATSGSSGIETGRIAGVDSIIFTEAIVGLTKLELEQDEMDDDGDDDGDDDHDNSEPGRISGDEDEGELEFKGEFVVDLLRGTSVPDFGIAEVVPGVYNEVEVKLSPILADGNTVFIKATIVTDDGLQYNIEYSNNFNIELELERESGIEITSGLNSILVLVNLDSLFNGIDFGMAEIDNDNVIRINANSNSIMAALIANNFSSSVKCGEDHDNDNDIDDDD